MDSFKCLVRGILCVVWCDDEMQSCMRNESIQPQVESVLRVRDPLDFRPRSRSYRQRVMTELISKINGEVPPTPSDYGRVLDDDS